MKLITFAMVDSPCLLLRKIHNQINFLNIYQTSALHAMLHPQASRSKRKNRPPDTSPCISIGGDKGWYRFKMFKYFKKDGTQPTPTQPLTQPVSHFS